MKIRLNFRIFSLITILSIVLSAAHSSGAAAATDTVFTFASMGDAQSDAYFSTTVNQIASLSPAFVLFNGDLEDNGMDTPEMDPMIADLKNAGLYNQTFLVRGNHDDVVSGSAALWENYFETAPNTKSLPAGVTDYVAINSSSNYLTYSYIYGNSMFIGMDVPGDVDLLTTAQLNWLDARLTYAESQSLTHAFIYFHGPMYCVESTHCSCTTRTDGKCTPAALVTLINKHPIISAFLHGHEHILGWTHMDNTRLTGLTGSFEEFITSPAGGYNYNAYVFPDRLDYYYNSSESTRGFATISVNGTSFTYSIYKDGTTTPVWSKTFTKGTSQTMAPTVTTQAVTSIGTTTATGNGTITSLGVPNPTQYGVVWDTAINPTIALSTRTQQGVPAGTGAFTSAITGLSAGMLYHVRAYATNTTGTAYGADVTFTPGGSAPTVTTQAVTNISQTTATGNGTITSLGVPNPTQYGVVWGTAINPTVALSTRTQQGAPTGTGAFTSAITGLSAGMLYHVRAYATNTAGTSYGGDVTFTTSGVAVAPTVTTQAVSAIGTTTATGNGTITKLGVPNPTQHGVVWATSANPTTVNSKTMDGPVSATGAFTSAITGLSAGTLYHVRAYATNTAGTAYGGDVTFTASVLAPMVTTQAATAIGTTTASGNGTIISLGVPNPTQYGVVWDTTINPTIALSTRTQQGVPAGTGTFTSVITGLSAGTLYHVRAYATNTAGTSYGGDVTFTTSGVAVAPTVTTQAVTLIGTTTATGNSNITSLGVPNPTEHGVVWATSANPTTANSKTTDGPVSATGAFTSAITGLRAGTIYHVRAYATNTAGTAYGGDVTFTTGGSAPTVTTQVVTSIGATTATGNGTITSLGVPNPTQYGVVWGTAINPTVALSTRTQQGVPAGTGAFTSTITGLSVGTLYHVRAYATNSAGTAYGADVQFVTNSTNGVTTLTTSGTWTAPAGVTYVTIEVWGGGGKGGSITSTSRGEVASGGGGGGAYTKANFQVIPGNNYSFVVGAGSTSTAAGGDSYFINTSTLLAKGGGSAEDNSTTAGAGGASSSGVGTTRYSGGNGANGSTNSNRGGGGGSSAGSSTNGNPASNAIGATAPAGGGNGGNARSVSSGNGTAGSAPGAAGGGAYRSSGMATYTGGAGANGQIRITYYAGVNANTVFLFIPCVTHR